MTLLLARYWSQLTLGVLAIALGTCYTITQRNNGALDLELKQRAAAQAAAIKFSDAMVDTAAQALRVRQAALDTLAAHQRADAAARARATQAVTAMASARDSALAVARDSASTTVQLRQAIVTVVARSRTDSVAQAREVARLQGDIFTRDRVIKADSTAIAAGIAAQQATLRRALGAESTVALLTRKRTGLLSRCGLSAGGGMVWAGGKATAGPTVLAGCRLLP